MMVAKPKRKPITFADFLASTGPKLLTKPGEIAREARLRARAIRKLRKRK